MPKKEPTSLEKRKARRARRKAKREANKRR